MNSYKLKSFFFLLNHIHVENGQIGHIWVNPTQLVY